MTTKQPKWKCVAILGDGDPINYGGAFVMVDQTGVYDPELRILVEPVFGGPDDKPQTSWIEYRVCLERHTFTDGILSDNPYHSAYPVWYWNKEGKWHKHGLLDVCESVGIPQSELIEMLCSDDPIQRASGYLILIGYYGPEEFDHYPLDLRENSSRVAWRYKSIIRGLKNAE